MAVLVAYNEDITSVSLAGPEVLSDSGAPGGDRWAMAARVGLKVLHTRPIGKLAAPTELTWEWPSSYLRIYLPKVAERGLLTADEVTAALADLERLSAIPEARILCPVVMETVLEV